MTYIGRLERVPLRELWKHEARDFTSWLAQNLDLLGEALGVDLALVQQEAGAGPFSVDILAEDGDGKPVVIENQLGQTDHDHLGKLLVYLSNLDAKTAIWIAADPRLEHEKAVHWLNEALPADTAFYLVKVEAYRIGDSPPAPQLTIVAGPSPEARKIGAEKKELAERHLLRLEFWRMLLESAKHKTQLHARAAPGTEHWVATGAGRSGLTYAYIIRLGDAQVELYIDRGDVGENKRAFDALLAHKEEIEREFGGPLEWQRLDDRRASRVRYVITEGGLQDRDQWPSIQEKMIDAMVRLERAMKPHIKKLQGRIGEDDVSP